MDRKARELHERFQSQEQSARWSRIQDISAFCQLTRIGRRPARAATPTHGSGCSWQAPNHSRLKTRCKPAVNNRVDHDQSNVLLNDRLERSPVQCALAPIELASIAPDA